MKTRLIKRCPLNETSSQIFCELRSRINEQFYGSRKRLAMLAKINDLEAIAIANNGTLNARITKQLYNISFGV